MEKPKFYAINVGRGDAFVEDAFNEWLLNELNPQWLLITTNLHDYEKHHQRWENLSRFGESRLFVLGQDQKIRWLVSTLPGEPEKMEKEANYG